MSPQPLDRLGWWNNLRHGGLLLDPPRLSALVTETPEPIDSYSEDRLRRRIAEFESDPNGHRSGLVHFVLEAICGFCNPRGQWSRGSDVSRAWSRKAITGETVRPQQLWEGADGSLLPVFLDGEKRIGVGKGKRVVSHALQWLRQGDKRLALVTNGHEWRLIYAGLDYDAFCEWHLSQFFSEGRVSAEFDGLRSLFFLELWSPAAADQPSPLEAAVNDSRKGQAELSQVLGERVRQAVEVLIQGHAPALDPLREEVDSEAIYHAGVRIIMRMVVALFAESRDGLLPLDNPIYHDGYSLSGLREQLARRAGRRLRESFSAYPRILSLFRLIYQGSSHEALLVPSYGGELFAPGSADSGDGLDRALAVFAQSCFQQELMADGLVKQILELLSRTKVRLRQGRSSTWLPAPVDFSSLESEYIGILYEGLLDFELRTAPPDEPVVFLAVGSQPALPLSTLEAMDDRSLRNLLERMSDASTDTGDDTESDDAELEENDPDNIDADNENEVDDAEEVDGENDDDVDEDEDEDEDEDDVAADVRHATRTRAEAWAVRACQVGNLVNRPRGRMTPEKSLQYEAALQRRARQIVPRVVLPGEWYLVRWGGTRKGSGTFYTRPQLAIPTVHRTLRPLAYDPPTGKDGQPDVDAPLESWTPKKPEEILALKVCDPACGSGSFPLAALRFLTEALYNALVVHDRFEQDADRTIIELIADREAGGPLGGEVLPARRDDPEFEQRTKAVLRRYVVERCIHGVDIDPLAVELCRLSLWIETLDRRLPFTFLDHKIKCGNSLVGAWFDGFLHYPAMAWEREGGDKSHSNGVHYRKDEWTKAIKARKKDVKADLIRLIDGADLIHQTDLDSIRSVHEEAEAAIREIHGLGIHETERRAARYEQLRQSEDFQRLKDAFDLWCSLWFWPPDQLDEAPLPTEHAEGAVSGEAREISREIARQRKFFHWELEFPDVFSPRSSGFDAMLGNPPWETLQPNSKEFFSEIDPMFRGYGKQEALAHQKEYFSENKGIEQRWLEFNAAFKAIANWMKFAGHPYGDRLTLDGSVRPPFDLNLGSGGRNSYETCKARHEKWKQKREVVAGYALPPHPFDFQGRGKAYTYKMFLEVAYSLLRKGGRLGLIVPSGLYSDHGTGDLRTLFLEHARWEWLFGFENREGIFDIHRSFKFNPTIVEKGSRTEAIRVAFMRRQLADWERAEQLATQYPRERVLQFSPHSKAILEIQSQRDLEVLTKIYSNSVLLGDQGPDGWGIKYQQGDFNMTSDSKLFPPRTKWEEWGYQPDEYSRWIKGPWKPIAELWKELGVDPTKPIPIDPECQREIDEGLASGEVGATEWQVRCAQPPYDTLPVPRADLPEGVILSRDGSEWIREDEIPEVTFTDARGRELAVRIETDAGETAEVAAIGPAVALPLYEGRMVGQFDFSQKGWVSGSGRSADWRDIDWNNKQIDPQYLMGQAAWLLGQKRSNRSSTRLHFMDVTSATNTRTMIATLTTGCPAGNKVPLLTFPPEHNFSGNLTLAGAANSLAYDFAIRRRLAGTTLNWFIAEETAIPRPVSRPHLVKAVSSLAMPSYLFAGEWLRMEHNKSSRPLRFYWNLTATSRLEGVASLNASFARLFGIDETDFRHIIAGCDVPRAEIADGQHESKGFWRIDKHAHPEHRLTILSLVAFLEAHDHSITVNVDEPGTDKDIVQERTSWLLPETICLSNYGLGQDQRARHPQPVRECFGPRYFDWQIAQSAEESWRECRLHARNLLGEDGFQKLIDELKGRAPSESTVTAHDNNGVAVADGTLFEKEHLPLFDVDEE